MFRRPSITAWHSHRAAVNFAAAVVALAGGAFAAASAGAETITVGVVANTQNGPLYLAEERNYFASEGLAVKVLTFDAAQPVAVAVASGDLDFGDVGATGGMYSLAGQGALRIIGGAAHEAPGFHLFALIAANRAYDAGLRSPTGLPGHSVAITQIGSSYHYSLALYAEKYRFDIASVRLLPMQAIPNISSAIAGNQADAAMLNTTATQPLLDRGDAKLISWVGDETPWQAVVLFAATKTAEEHHDEVERFLRAYRKGARIYHDAFADPEGHRRDGPDAPEVLTILSKRLGMPVERVKQSIAYLDADARLDVQDILHQIAWYKSQGMVKGPVNGEDIIDKRYVVPLPER